MCSARRLMVFNVCVKFHENMSSGFKVMERTRKLLTHTHTQKRRKHYTPMAYLVCRGYNYYGMFFVWYVRTLSFNGSHPKFCLHFCQ